MIDYGKINHFPVKAEQILLNNHLTFPLSNIATTGEILHRAQVAHYGAMEFVVKDGYVKLKGSLHKHAQGNANYGDFSICDIRKAIEEMAGTFHFEPADAQYNFIEIGVNIEVSKDPSILIRNFLLYKQKAFETLPITRVGYGKQCRLEQFTIKIYNKSLQYHLPNNLLRFEVKVTRMEFLKKYGIYKITMADLQGKEVYSKLLVMLLEVFNQILIANPDIDIDLITNQKDKDLVSHGVYPEYWQNLPRQRKSEQIKKFVVLSGTNYLKNQLSEQIKEKWNQLLNPDKITTCETEQIILPNSQSGQNNTSINGKRLLNGYSRSCPITGINITMQKESSHFLSTSGLKLLKQNDFPKFEEIRRRFLPRSGVSGKHTKHETDEISHIAKQIRNEYYNVLRYKKIIPHNQLTFF